MKKSNFGHLVIISFFAILLFSLTICGNPQEKPEQDISFYKPVTDISSYPLLKEKGVKNIILLIGDGMGFAQVDAARIRATGAAGRLNMERMPVTGFVKTHSANRLITDSAAAGTALSTGCKTNNGVIAMSPNGKNFMTILEAAQKKGMGTGLVVTSNITDATPSVFASHIVSRRSQPEIALQLVKSGVNVLLGGGKEFFIPKSITESKRGDEQSPLDEARAKGYLIVDTRQQLTDAKGDHVLGLFQMDSLKTTGDEPSLAEMAQKAIALLKPNKNGFFMMVEGSQIDWGCHANNPDYVIRQVLLFDEAVKVALAFAAENTDTLVVVTADHETGGLAIIGGNLDGTGLVFAWAKKDHTAVQVPVYAFGPQAILFMGVQDNTDVARKLSIALGIGNFPLKQE